MSDAGSDRSSTTMRASLARGKELAARDAAKQAEAKAEASAKLEAAKQLAEKRKSYGRVQRRVASPVVGKVSAKRPASPVAKPANASNASNAVPALRKADGGNKKRGPTPQGTPHKGGARKKSGILPPRASAPSAHAAAAATAAALRGTTAPPSPTASSSRSDVQDALDALAMLDEPLHHDGPPTPEEIENRPAQQAPASSRRGMPNDAHPPQQPRRPGAPLGVLGGALASPGPLARLGGIFGLGGNSHSHSETAAPPPPPALPVVFGERCSSEELLASDDEAFEDIEKMCLEGAPGSPPKVAKRAPAGTVLEELANSPEHTAPRSSDAAQTQAAAAQAAQAAVQAAEAAEAAIAAADAARAALETELAEAEEEAKREEAKEQEEAKQEAAAAVAAAAAAASNASAGAPGGGEGDESRTLFDRQPFKESGAAGEAAESAAAAAIKDEGGVAKPVVRRQERGSLFARLRLGGGSPEPKPPTPDMVGQMNQQLEAMSEQLEAVTSCMRVEQQARCAAESQLAETREQVQGLLKHLSETEKARKEEASTLAALRGLLEQIQVENTGLKEQNASLVSECRTLSGREMPTSRDHREEPRPQAATDSRGKPVAKR